MNIEKLKTYINGDAKTDVAYRSAFSPFRGCEPVSGRASKYVEGYYAGLLNAVFRVIDRNEQKTGSQIALEIEKLFNTIDGILSAEEEEAKANEQGFCDE